MTRLIVSRFVFLLPVLIANAGGNNLESVSSYIDRSKITLSGFSSGGSFAQMMQFAHSSLFSGIAVFSHTYYRCGSPSGNITEYDMLCTKLINQNESKWYNPELVHKDIADYERKNLIEPTYNLRNKRLYVYAGLQNALFTPKQSLAVVGIYERYLGSLATVYTRVQEANLVLPTVNRGGKCSEADEKEFFIAKCGFSGVRDALNYLLFPYERNDAFDTNTGKGLPSPTPRLQTFDQTEFSAGEDRDSLDDTGFYYIPDSCKRLNSKQKCYLHLYFHGCLTGREFAKTQHIENSGLLEYAKEKGIIMVFPQVKSIQRDQINEIGCWDTFGIFGELYATREGPQVKAVKKMIDRLLGRNNYPQSSNAPSRPSNSYYESKGNGNYNGNYHNYNRHSPHSQHRYSSYFQRRT